MEALSGGGGGGGGDKEDSSPPQSAGQWVENKSSCCLGTQYTHHTLVLQLSTFGCGHFPFTYKAINELAG